MSLTTHDVSHRLPATQKAAQALKRICAETGEKQYVALERILTTEAQRQWNERVRREEATRREEARR